jgi:lysophospholipase L1-like esterase
VVAFYTGNDSIETLAVARHIERWRFLLDGIPDTAEPLVSDRTKWSAALGNERVDFTPRLRLLANRRDGASVKAGYAIMARVAGLIAQKGKAAGVRVIFTAIPTKETVYRDLIRTRGIEAPADYRQLVADEAANVAEFRASIEGSGGTYVDLVTPMTAAALRHSDLYPPEDGHPNANGYRLIADALAPAVAAALPDPPRGYVALSAAKEYPFYQVSPGIAGSAHLIDQRAVFFIDDDGAWLVDKPEPWLGAVPIEYRDIANLPQRGFLSHRPP